MTTVRLHDHAEDDVIFEFLNKVPLFKGLSDSDLHQLCETVKVVMVPEGKELFVEGSEGDKAYIIRQGELEIVKESAGREVLLAVRGEGVVIGEMALLESAPRSASVRARTSAVLYAIDKENFDALLARSPSAMNAMLNTMLGRFRENQGLLRQSEKMAQLGTLTAGVAHELNNPAAAVQRSADQLREAMGGLSASYARIGVLGFNEEQEASLNILGERARLAAEQPAELDALARSDREYEIEQWLNDRGKPNAWETAPNLVSLNFDEAGLTKLTEDFNDEQVNCVIDWLNNTYNVHSLLNELMQGAGRISAIVKALKSYAYLDQAPTQQVDIHEGLDNTLVILRSKLKTGINVKREYAENLPHIHGYGSELNQVWTNLIDNAVDALAGSENPQIILRTRQEGKWVIVDVEDNGMGIPPENQSKVFDSFFTTKPVGKGTGLGLDISYNIVVTKHRGDIKLRSKPGETVFSVWLPQNFEEPK
ncbi:MAG: cyclic nucleotide-binding domain-containing protein [Anaerolineae bacterium]|nr:MAG: cyclic nucleotide-binding domain-containing protein [Anaerolineae bacterium]